MTKTFIVAAVSSNRNAFGLTGLILIAPNGEAWQVGASDLHVKAMGSTIIVHNHDFGTLGFEIPERLPNAPESVVKEVWEAPHVH